MAAEADTRRIMVHQGRSMSREEMTTPMDVDAPPAGAENKVDKRIRRWKRSRQGTRKAPLKIPMSTTPPWSACLINWDAKRPSPAGGRRLQSHLVEEHSCGSRGGTRSNESDRYSMYLFTLMYHSRCFTQYVGISYGRGA